MPIYILIRCHRYHNRFDSERLKWTIITDLLQKRSEHTGTLSSDDEVLLVGDYAQTPLSSCEIYQTSSRVSTRTTNLFIARFQHTHAVKIVAILLILKNIGVES